MLLIRACWLFKNSAQRAVPLVSQMVIKAADMSSTSKNTKRNFLSGDHDPPASRQILISQNYSADALFPQRFWNKTTLKLKPRKKKKTPKECVPGLIKRRSNVFPLATGSSGTGRWHQMSGLSRRFQLRQVPKISKNRSWPAHKDSPKKLDPSWMD